MTPNRFFDLEFAILFSLGLVKVETPCVAIVHDCQVLDENFIPEDFDTGCDLIITPSRMIEVGKSHAVQKPTCGILWDQLQPGMLDDIPPLKELRDMNSTIGQTPPYL